MGVWSKRISGVEEHGEQFSKSGGEFFDSICGDEPPLPEKLSPLLIEFLGAYWSNLMTAHSWAVHVEVLFKLMYVNG